MSRIFLVVFPGSLKSSIHGMIDILEYSSRLFGKKYSIDRGAEIPEDLTVGDYCVFPAMSSAESDLAALNCHYGNSIVQLYKRGVILCSICLSAFLLAHSGIVGQKRLTTHWKAAERLKAMFPEILVDATAILIDQGGIISAGGLTAYNDLALHLVGKAYGVRHAAEIARIFLLNRNRQSQLPYWNHSYREVDDSYLRALIDYVDLNMDRELSLTELETELGLNKRSLNRRSMEHLGIPPGRLIRYLKLDHGADLIDQGLSVAESAYKIGYQDIPAFCRAFQKYKGLSPGRWRNR